MRLDERTRAGRQESSAHLLGRTWFRPGRPQCFGTALVLTLVSCSPSDGGPGSAGDPPAAEGARAFALAASRAGEIELTWIEGPNEGLFELRAASWKPDEGHPALLRAFAEAEGARGHLRMGIARIDGIPVAAQYWTVEDGTAFIHKLAHVEDSLKASPGTLLSAALFRHVIDIDKVKRVDFGTGNDGYKRDWMNRHDPLWRIEAFNPSRPAAWGPTLKAFARSLLRKEK